MTRDELMTLTADNAAAELELESIEFLFKPRTMLELLLRLNFQGTKNTILKGIVEHPEDQYHSREPYSRKDAYGMMRKAIKVEEFHRAILAARAA